MDSIRKISKIAGLFYLVVVITGIFSLAYIPSQLFDWSNPSKTFTNISSNEFLFRLSLAAGVLCYISFLFLPLVLYKFLKPVNDWYAKLMVLLALISIPVSFLNLHHKYAVLNMVTAVKYKSVALSDDTLNGMMTHLNSYNSGIFIVTVFWGLWLFPFGYLVLKSNLFPKIFGYLLMLGCFGYVINFFGSTLSYDYSSTVVSKVLRFLPTIGELGICIWLLLVGAKEKRYVI